MSKLLLGTTWVSLDEPGYSLKEIVQRTPDSKALHRYQCIRVLRGDQVAEFRRDLGPASGFSAGEFVIPGGVTDEHSGRIYVEHKVAELVEIADLLREGPYQRPEPPTPSNLIQGYQDLPDKRRRARKRQSLFGPAATIQRS